MLRSLIAEGLAREDSTFGWNFMKFISLSHFLDDMIEYGPASGVSTSTGERGLKTWAKQPAASSQKRNDETHCRQVCFRLYETSILEQVIESTHSNQELLYESTSPDDGKVTEATTILRDGSFVVEINRQFATGHRQTDTGKRHRCPIDVPSEILDWYLHEYKTLSPITIQLYTELVLKDPDQPDRLLRCHPNFRMEGKWFDYCLVSFEGDTDKNISEFPLKLCSLFHCPRSGENKALLHDCVEESIDCESTIFKKWSLKSKKHRNRLIPVFVAVNVASIIDVIYAIELYPEGGFSKDEEKDYEFIVPSYQETDWPLRFLDCEREYKRKFC